MLILYVLPSKHCNFSDVSNLCRGPRLRTANFVCDMTSSLMRITFASEGNDSPDISSPSNAALDVRVCQQFRVPPAKRA